MNTEKHANEMSAEEKKAALEDAATDMSSAVYKAAALYERLENRGLILGNGHHIRQQLAREAVLMLRDRWLSK